VSRAGRRLGFAARASRSGIRRNRIAAVAASLTMAAMLTLLGVAYVANATLDAAGAWATARVEVVGYLRDGTKGAAVTALVRRLESIEGVAAVRSVDPDTALAEFRARLAERGEPDLTVAMEGNPLPASVEVTMADAGSVGLVAEALRASTAVERVVDLADAAGRIAAIAAAARLAGLIAFTVAAAIALLVVNAAIRLAVAARRDELEIMHLVGASDGFIRLPFLLEGAAFGSIGAVGGAVLVGLLLAGLGAGSADGPLAGLGLRPSLGLEAAVLLLTAGLVAGVAGSALATRAVRR
jgi:cell division transport system permease protein